MSLLDKDLKFGYVLASVDDFQQHVGINFVSIFRCHLKKITSLQVVESLILTIKYNLFLIVDSQTAR